MCILYKHNFAFALDACARKVVFSQRGRGAVDEPFRCQVLVAPTMGLSLVARGETRTCPRRLLDCCNLEHSKLDSR